MKRGQNLWSLIQIRWNGSCLLFYKTTPVSLFFGELFFLQRTYPNRKNGLPPLCLSEQATNSTRIKGISFVFSGMATTEGKIKQSSVPNQNIRFLSCFFMVRNFSLFFSRFNGIRKEESCYIVVLWKVLCLRLNWMIVPEVVNHSLQRDCIE